METNFNKKDKLDHTRKVSEKTLVKKESNFDLIPGAECNNDVNFTHIHHGRPELKTKLSILQAKEKDLNINNIREV